MGGAVNLFSLGASLPCGYFVRSWQVLYLFFRRIQLTASIGELFQDIQNGYPSPSHPSIKRLNVYSRLACITSRTSVCLLLRQHFAPELAVTLPQSRDDSAIFFIFIFLKFFPRFPNPTMFSEGVH